MPALDLAWMLDVSESWPFFLLGLGVLALVKSLQQFLWPREPIVPAGADGGSIVARVLHAHGVKSLFTLSGGHISPLLVSAKAIGIRVVDVRHEVNTVFAADAVSRLTGVPGVAAVTAGPGLTNTITAVKNAQMAQSPVVLLGGATATALKGRGALQDIDQLSLIRPHVKWFKLCSKVAEIQPALEQAFAQAQSGVPGPVFVELPLDLLYPATVVRGFYASSLESKSASVAKKIEKAYVTRHLRRMFADLEDLSDPSVLPVTKPLATSSQVSAALRMLMNAERPVIVLGAQAVLEPAKVMQVQDAVTTLGLPVYLSSMARGLMGTDSPLQFRHKRGDALKQADVVMLVGVPCDFRMGYGALLRGKYISVNRDPLLVAKNKTPTLTILADSVDFMISLAKMKTKQYADRHDSHLEQWLATLQQREDARDQQIAKQAADHVEPDNPLHIAQMVEKYAPDNALFVADGGDIVATVSYVARPRGPLTWLDPGPFGTLGCGSGFAIGAAVACPDKVPWIIFGDGAVGFSIAEFDTFARHGFGVVAIVGNDACWTQIARDQIELLGDDVALNLEFTNYQDAVVAFGGAGFLSASAKELEAAFKKTIKHSQQHPDVPVMLNALMGKSDFRKGSLSV